MQTYKYQARQRGGQQVSGTVVAESPTEAARQVRAKSLYPIKVEPESSGGLSLSLSIGTGISGSVLAQFYSQVSDLLRAGVPLMRTLTLLGERTPNKRLAEIVKDIGRRVADGEPLSDAMTAHRQVFGDLTISMVRAGQEGGFLEDIFEQIASFTERQEELKGKVVGALAYPVFLLLIGMSVVAVLLLYFVPQFGKIFDRLRARGELPWATEMLLTVSEAARDYGLVLLGLAIVGYIAMKRYLATEAGRRMLDTVKLQVPLMGAVWRDLAITRFNRILGTLRHAGVPILPSLRIAKDSTGNVLMQDAIVRAAENVRGGDKLAKPLRESGVFPSDIVEMIEVAEESNTLEQVLLSSADRLEKRTTRQLEIAVRFLEPILLLVMAAIVLLVVVALLLPIFRMSSALT